MHILYVLINKGGDIYSQEIFSLFEKERIWMARYYVNKNEQDNGDHEVHTTGCGWIPLSNNRIYLSSQVTMQQSKK